jgi:hypothetical protein
MRDFYIPIAIQRKIKELSNGYCEYCLHPENHSTDFFQFDHIIPIVEGGSNELKNLARCCGFCNNLKKGKTHYFDSVTNSLFPIFNPRKEIWTDHFEWSDDFLLLHGLTKTGQATIDLLQLNRENLQNLRSVLHRGDLHPPKFSILT